MGAENEGEWPLTIRTLASSCADGDNRAKLHRRLNAAAAAVAVIVLTPLVSARAVHEDSRSGGEARDVKMFLLLVGSLDTGLLKL